jgi:hypothetical protein
LTRKRLYLTLIIIYSAGILWLAGGVSVNACLFRRVTGIPCPSCGTTRALHSLFNGNFSEALLLNPIGYILALAIICLPPWMLYDLIFKKESLLKFYKSFEKFFLNNVVMITAIILLIANWIWNIIKYR